MDKEQAFKKLLEEFPEYKDNQKAIKFFDTLYVVAPNVAGIPLLVKSFFKETFEIYSGAPYSIPSSVLTTWIRIEDHLAKPQK